jgi:hypothetical protein
MVLARIVNQIIIHMEIGYRQAKSACLMEMTMVVRLETANVTFRVAQPNAFLAIVVLLANHPIFQTRLCTVTEISTTLPKDST